MVKESVGTAQIPVLRKNGADGEVSVRWRTIGAFNFRLVRTIVPSFQDIFLYFLKTKMPLAAKRIKVGKERWSLSTLR